MEELEKEVLSEEAETIVEKFWQYYLDDAMGSTAMNKIGLSIEDSKYQVAEEHLRHRIRLGI